MILLMSQIESWLYAVIWPFCRIAGLMMGMVFFGSTNISMRIRILFAVAVTAVVAPVLPPMPRVDLFSLEAYLLVIVQTLVGVAIGFVTRLVFETFVVGGQVIAMQTGLGFAQLVDPSSGVSLPALSQFFTMIATLLFLALNGHHLLVEVVVASFETLPVRLGGIRPDSLHALVLWARWVFGAGLLMAFSAVVALLTVNLVFGIMTRAAPQLNIFAVGFPITLTAGLFFIWLTLGLFMSHFDEHLLRGKSLICEMANMEC